MTPHEAADVGVDELRRVLDWFELATRWVADVPDRSDGDVTNYRLTGLHIRTMKEAREKLRATLTPRGAGD